MRREHLVEQPDDHRHEHRHGKADNHLGGEIELTHVRLDEFEHADIGRHPGQRTEAEDKEDFLPIATRPFRFHPIVVVAIGIADPVSISVQAAVDDGSEYPRTTVLQT